jgi:hypothetical protein
MTRLAIIAGAVLIWTVGAVAVGLQWNYAEVERLQKRVNALETTKDLRNEAANTSDDDLADSISDVQ